MSTTNQFLDVGWLLVCAALVMMMQAGFSCLESGLVRTKNSINVAAKNFADFCVSSALFWLFGFALMFGVTYGGVFGTSGFLFGDTKNPWLMAFFIFQLGFCGTATTIVSGAVAERTRFAGYLVIATILSALIYPFVGHWVWGSAAGANPGGWLEQMGFIDFAGSTVVHSVGGWISLAAIIIIGPRIGRFGKDRVPIQGHDLPFVTLGVFLLWFGWFGFNGGSTLGLTPAVPIIIVNTTVSGAFGGLVAMALAWRLGGRPDVAMIMNGSLAGLVGITASANIMTPLAAASIGSVAAVVMYGVTVALERLEIDDVVGAVPVHLAAGIWGTLAVAIFGDPASWGTGLGRWDQLVVQAAGVGAVFAWAFGVGFTLLWLINRWFPLRITPRGERLGLNVVEHGASTEILDLLTEMDSQRRAGDFSQPVTVEPHTEVGQIARQYNRVLVDIDAEHRRREAVTETLREKTASLQLLQEAATAANQAKSIDDAIHTCVENVCAFGGWPVGHCYMVYGATGELVSANIWHLDDAERFSVFREVTEKTELQSGDDLPGRVMESGEPAWIADVTKDDNFPRAKLAEDIGVKGAAAFPVLIGEDVVAVLEFFSPAPVEPDETMLEVMASVGTQLGRVVERKRSEAARFKSVVDNMPAHVHLRDRSGRFILINREYEKFYGVTNDFVRGKTLHEVGAIAGVDFAPDQNVARDHEVIEKNRIVEQDYTVKRHGKLRALTDVKFPIRDHSGEIIAVGGIERDITELKRAEEELRDSEERLRIALENMTGGMFMVDKDLNLQVMSPSFKAIYQLPPDLVPKGAPLSDIIRFRAERGDYGPGDPKDLTEKRLTGYRDREISRVETTLPGGKVIELFRTPTADGGVVAVFNEITDRKRAEEALEKAYGIIRDQKERMEAELNIGRDIQMSMIPLIFPPFPDHDEFSIFGTLQPAREVGGDFYDFYFLDDERLCFCIGDVSGKGVPAALFMAMAKTLIKSRATDDRSTASILTHVNDELSAADHNSMFVTIFAGILNIRTGELTYTNAGHNPPHLKRQDGTVHRLDQRHGPIIGAIEGMVYKEQKDTMEPGDLLLLYSDGVTEAMDPADRLFSENRLKELLTSTDTDDVEAVVDTTVSAVRAFEGDAEQADDITLLGLKFHGSPKDALTAERRIVIRNQLPEIAALNEKFEAFAAENGVPAPVATKFNLVFEELLNNVISYAYRDDDPHDIEVRVEVAGKRLTVTITDDGVPFNPLGVETPEIDLSLEDRDVGGLGIHLVRHLVDDVSYQRRIDKNVLTLMRNLKQEAGAH